MIRKSLVFILSAGFLLTATAAGAVGIGDKAPLFTAVSDKGEVNLQDYLGKSNVIVAFYFAINTPA